MDYRILQMDEDQDRMYVGCKDNVLSMDINNITHGTLKVSSLCSSLFWCGAGIERHRGENKTFVKCNSMWCGVILICAMICKLPYICRDHNNFGVIQKRPRKSRSSLMTDSACGEGVIFSVIDRREVHKQMGKRFGSSGSAAPHPFFSPSKLLDVFTSRTFKHSTFSTGGRCLWSPTPKLFRTFVLLVFHKCSLRWWNLDVCVLRLSGFLCSLVAYLNV